MTEKSEAVESQSIEEAISEMKANFDQLYPWIRETVRRNRAFDELMQRLQVAERKLDARTDRPIVIAILKSLHRIRRLDMQEETRAIIDDELVSILRSAGYDEVSVKPGDEFDANLHEAIDGNVSEGTAIVSIVHSNGLLCLDEVIRTAKVTVTSS